VESWFLELGGRRLALGPGETVIGRGRDCDLVVDDPTVSRNHALLSIAEDRVTLQDLESSNGTFVDGRRLRGETVLAAGARLRFGRVRGGLGRGGVAPGLGPEDRFCIACGDSVPRGAEICPSCGEPLSPERRMSRSEAIGVSDVLPVGEALASPARGLDETRPPFPLSWEADLDATGAHGPWRPEAAAPEEGAGPTREAERGRETSPPETEPAGGEGVREAAVPEPPAPVDPVSEELALEELDAPEREDRGAPLFLPAAGFWRRSAAALVDGIGVAAAGAAGWAVAGAAGLAAPAWPAWASGLAVAVVVWLAVSVVGWSRWGTTPGKRWLDLWVCDLDGRPGIGAGRAFGRWLGYLASAALLGTGFLAVGLGASRRALHDRLAGTYVARGEGGRRRRPGRG